MSDFKDDLTLDDLRKEFGKEQPKNPYVDFFLLSNPFPDVGQFISGICVNQDQIKREFVRTLREFYQDEQSRRMMIRGSTGAGKTNLLKFFEQELEEWHQPSPGEQAITNLFTIFIDQPQGGYFEIHRQIISQLGARFFREFFEAVQRGKVNLAKLPTELPGISPELIRILTPIASDRSSQLSLWPEPRNLRTLEEWLQGSKLSAEVRKHLSSVSIEVGKSSTIAIKFLADLVKIFRYAKLFKGLIILFDEFENILSGLSSTRQAQYAQDLRNLFDSLSESVVFVIATTPFSDDLRRISPALNRRLGEGVEIEPIQDEDSALAYAREYTELARKTFRNKTNRNISFPANCSDADLPYYPLTRSTVTDVYREIRDRYNDVLPGDLLPELNRRLYRQVYKGS